MYCTALLLQCFYATYGYNVLMMIPCFLIFYATFMILMLIKYKCFTLIDEADMTSVVMSVYWKV